jgi:hypothetical protein
MIRAVTLAASLAGLFFSGRAWLAARRARALQGRLRDDLERLARE